MEPVTLRLPSAWAPYLLYGDDTGLEPEEIKAIDNTLRANCLRGDPCQCEEFGFCALHDAFADYPMAADCAEYVWLV